MISDQELHERFIYHSVSDEASERIHTIRTLAKALARYIIANTPESREQSLAVTHIEEATFWANAAIARHDERSIPI